MKKIILGQLYNILARNKKGFTLVELIIVITILAILATIAFISFQNYSGNARDSNRISTIKNIETGLELFTLKTSQLPNPDETKTYTGGTDGTSQINQGIIGESVVKIIDLSHIPLDPKDKTNYVYSTFGTSHKYYQVGINSENSVLSFIPQTYASSKSSIVKGNYKFDPTLPSLIVVENEALTNSGIFSPDVCFVMDNGNNNLNECREKKSEMILKNYDNSLVGYWDMETLTGNLLKDLSGNQNNGTFSGNILPSSIDGYFGKALYFSGGYIEITNNQNLNIDNVTITALVYYGNFSTTIGNVSIVEKSYSGGAILPYYQYKLGLTTNSHAKYPNGSIAGSFSINNNYQILTSPNLNSFAIGEKFFLSTSFNGEKIKVYKNGILVSFIDVRGELGKFDSKLCFGRTFCQKLTSPSINELFNGIIDDIKIYNRALNDEEVFEQAKIAGF